MNIIETKLDMTEDEAKLKVCERLIVAKQEALMSAPVPDRTYSNAHRRGAELDGLKKLAAELAMSVAAYKKAMKARN